jgi:hypothetical protein
MEATAILIAIAAPVITAVAPPIVAPLRATIIVIARPAIIAARLLAATPCLTIIVAPAIAAIIPAEIATVVIAAPVISLGVAPAIIALEVPAILTVAAIIALAIAAAVEATARVALRPLLLNRRLLCLLLLGRRPTPTATIAIIGAPLAVALPGGRTLLLLPLRPLLLFRPGRRSGLRWRRHRAAILYGRRCAALTAIASAIRLTAAIIRFGLRRCQRRDAGDHGCGNQQADTGPVHLHHSSPMSEMLPAWILLSPIRRERPLNSFLSVQKAYARLPLAQSVKAALALGT